jgi:hypothetical protein
MMIARYLFLNYGTRPREVLEWTKRELILCVHFLIEQKKEMDKHKAVRKSHRGRRRRKR